MLGVTAAEAQVPNFHDETSLIFFSFAFLMKCWSYCLQYSSNVGCFIKMRVLVSWSARSEKFHAPPSIGQNEV